MYDNVHTSADMLKIPVPRLWEERCAWYIRYWELRNEKL